MRRDEHNEDEADPAARRETVTLPNGERRVELVVDIGTDPATGKRRQARRRFRTATEANDEYAKVRAAVDAGTYVARSRETLASVCEAWLNGKRNLKPKTAASYRDALKPLLAAYGAQPVQALTKAQLDELVDALTTGGTLTRGDGKPRRQWSGRMVAIMLRVLGNVLDDAIKQGHVARNVAVLVERPNHAPKQAQTWTKIEVRKARAAAQNDRLEVAWLLSLYGLRRGEVAGLKWDDFTDSAFTINRARVSVDGRVVEDTPKSAKSPRTLPVTTDLKAALRRLRKTQAAERLAAGSVYVDSGYLVVDEVGRPVHPESLTAWWEQFCQAAGVRRIRLHDARHTCGTLMHLAGEPAATISAWPGHSSVAFTMRTYVHGQAEALTGAAVTLQNIYGA